MIKKTKDTNFSCMDSVNYGNRFRYYVKSIVKINDHE